MSPRPEDVRQKQLQHEKHERIKLGLEKLERHSGKIANQHLENQISVTYVLGVGNKSQASPKKGGQGSKGVWGR